MIKIDWTRVNLLLKKITRAIGVFDVYFQELEKFIWQHLWISFTASPKVLKIFSHPQNRDQSQVVQNEKLSQESVETKIFVGGNGTFSHFFEKKLKKIWKKISKKIFFLIKFVFLG